MKPAETFLPAEYIRDELAARGWTMDTFCFASGLRQPLADEVVAGKRPVTRMIARCLAQAFGTDEVFWLKLQEAAEAGGKE